MIHAHSAHAEGSAQHPAPIAASSSTAALAQTTGIQLTAIAYVSTAITPLMVPTLELLHRRAVDHNRRHRITGVLLYNAGNFMQYLEGPQSEVAPLYARIEADARHKQVVQLLSGPIVPAQLCASGTWVSRRRRLPMSWRCPRRVGRSFTMRRRSALRRHPA